jgi:GTP-binding protein
MKILNAEFVLSCTSLAQMPKDGLPEVAFVGRSNVGKSSLINALLHRKGLAKVSGTPGKTRLLNVFRVATDDARLRSLYFVDLPGYGYAKVARSLRQQWGPMIEEYLAARESLVGVVMLMDARGMQRSDTTTWEWLGALPVPSIPVATKVDKLSRSERTQALRTIRETLSIPEGESAVAFSSVTREGIDELWGAIRELVS